MKEGYSKQEIVLKVILPYLVILMGGILAITGEYSYGIVVTLIGIADLLYHKSVYNLIDKLEVKGKELNQWLVQSQKLAALGELSAGIAHEINNPLAIMAQEIEWIKYVIDNEIDYNSEKFEEIKDGIAQVSIQINRCKDITHRLLSFARKTEPVLQETNINDIVRDMATLVERHAKLLNISVVSIFSKNIPNIMTDPPLIRQVILNLLNNALSAVGENGRIVIRTWDEDGYVCIGVKDNGPGIPQELLGRIFDPFFTTKDPKKGTGLGLTISQGIVNRLGGRIEVESQVGKGALFKVYLPKEVKGDGR